jgi:hypothetical protein
MKLQVKLPADDLFSLPSPDATSEIGWGGPHPARVAPVFEQEMHRQGKEASPSYDQETIPSKKQSSWLAIAALLALTGLVFLVISGTRPGASNNILSSPSPLSFPSSMSSTHLVADLASLAIEHPGSAPSHASISS